jgi:phage major head subunit gpT-like protein
MSNSSNNSWNMMSTTVRMGMMMNEFQPNKTKTTIKQVRVSMYGVLGQHGSRQEWIGDW